MQEPRRGDVRTRRGHQLLATWIALLLCTGAIASVNHDGSETELRSSGALTGPEPAQTLLTAPPVSLELRVPEVTIPEITVPEITVPEVTIPEEITIPEITVPDVTVVDDILGGHADPSAIDRNGLWLVDTDRDTATVLFEDLYPSGVSFSPDGRQAVVTTVEDSSYNGALPETMWLVDLGTRRRRELIEPTTRSLNSPSWSPDGAWIAYSTLPDPAEPPVRSPSARPGVGAVSEIWLVRPDGTDRHRLAVVDGFGGRLSWSPDGGRLTASLWNDGRILVADVRAGTERRFPASDPYLTDWSPDGTRLVYSSSHRGPTSIVDPSTGGTTVLANDAWFPRWSPDGAWIAVRRGDEAVLLRPNGTGGRVLGNGSPVNWSDDSRFLTFQEGTRAARVADIREGTARTVAASVDKGPSLIPSAWAPGSHTLAVIAAPVGWYAP